MSLFSVFSLLLIVVPRTFAGIIPTLTLTLPTTVDKADLIISICDNDAEDCERLLRWPLHVREVQIRLYAPHRLRKRQNRRRFSPPPFAKKSGDNIQPRYGLSKGRSGEVMLPFWSNSTAIEGSVTLKKEVIPFGGESADRNVVVSRVRVGKNGLHWVLLTFGVVRPEVIGAIVELKVAGEDTSLFRLESGQVKKNATTMAILPSIPTEVIFLIENKAWIIPALIFLGIIALGVIALGVAACWWYCKKRRQRISNSNSNSIINVNFNVNVGNMYFNSAQE